MIYGDSTHFAMMCNRFIAAGPRSHCQDFGRMYGAGIAAMLDKHSEADAALGRGDKARAAELIADGDKQLAAFNFKNPQDKARYEMVIRNTLNYPAYKAPEQSTASKVASAALPFIMPWTLLASKDTRQVIADAGAKAVVDTASGDPLRAARQGGYLDDPSKLLRDVEYAATGDDNAIPAPGKCTALDFPCHLEKNKWKLILGGVAVLGSVIFIYAFGSGLARRLIG